MPKAKSPYLAPKDGSIRRKFEEENIDSCLISMGQSIRIGSSSKKRTFREGVRMVRTFAKQHRTAPRNLKRGGLSNRRHV